LSELSQILAISIFILMFIVIITGKIHRFIPALIGAALVIIVIFLIVLRDPHLAIQVLNYEQLFQARFWLPGHEPLESRGINWQTIIFIAGMMVMVEGMALTGFFTWLCLHVAKIAHYKVIPILIGFMLLSGVLSMFIDSITVLLFMTVVIIELARLLKFDPVPIIIATIFAANVGGSATMSGDPPNIIIGTALGYTFMDFIVNTGPIAWTGLLLALGIFYLMFRKSLKTHGSNLTVNFPEPGDAVRNRWLFTLNTLIFILIIILLVTHAQTGLSVGFIGIIAGILTLIVSFRSLQTILKRIDWRTLLFFVGLFVCVSGLEETGVLQILAEYIGNISGGNMLLVIPIILWVSAVASAVVDNIPFAATMVPVIAELSQTSGFPLPALAWTLALGTDIGGNATPIGASANVVGTAIAEREGYHISWGRFIKYSAPATIVVVALCWLCLILRYGMG
jgi:Na+/H+ antiporter NhaD/arsenite permease-like protein